MLSVGTLYFHRGRDEARERETERTKRRQDESEQERG